MATLAKPEHEIAYQAIAALLAEQEKKGLSGPEMLAIASNIVGKIIAAQDQRHMSRDRAMRIVAANIELGNQQAIAELMKSKGSA